MHELGVLHHVVNTVERIAKENKIKTVKHVTLEVGDSSGYVPHYLMKLFPIAIDGASEFNKCELKLEMVKGSRLTIKDIGY